MLLKEFFGKGIDPIKMSHKNGHGDRINDELFWFIIDHDKLHKDYFHPLAVKIKKSFESNKDDKEKFVKEFMPMVKKGCKEFYIHKKMKGSLGHAFPEELRKDMCERLFDHYREDIIKEKYKVGA
jgi:hypothetical protein